MNATSEDQTASNHIKAPSMWVQASSPLMHRVFMEIVSDHWVLGKMKVPKNVKRIRERKGSEESEEGGGGEGEMALRCT